ncbi:MAG: triose-phosphate isomerase [Acidobacteriota bacterium]|nr:triose-phosphate isomerase [Acidobacteriota bacterium]
MSRKKLVVGNWKMHHTRSETLHWWSRWQDMQAQGERPDPDRVDLGVAPPFTSLATLIEARAAQPLLVGAQNVHWESSGAFTGEVSAEMLAEAGCDFVIIGHSERRQIFGETDTRIARKVAAAHRAGLLPILCVGESADERSAGRMEVVVEEQLQRALDGVAWKDPEALVLAYEPIWAIGTGQTATPAQAQAAHRFLREILASMAGAEVAAGVRILYGGSVKPANAAELAAEEDIDGFLVGGASLDAASFAAIAR